MSIAASPSPSPSPSQSAASELVAGAHLRRASANAKSKEVTTTAGSSSASTDDATHKIPTVTVPPTKDAPFRRSSSLPDGFVFIVVGATIGFAFLCVLAWRALVAWSVNRSVGKVVAVGMDDAGKQRAGPSTTHAKGGDWGIGGAGYSTSRADLSAGSRPFAAGAERGRRYEKERGRVSVSVSVSPSSSPSPQRGIYTGTPRKAPPSRDNIFTRGFTNQTST